MTLLQKGLIHHGDTEGAQRFTEEKLFPSAFICGLIIVFPVKSPMDCDIVDG
jgi:hypothetical protein